MLLTKLCPGCGSPDRFICPSCWSALPWLAPDVPALWHYEGPARAVVLAAKNGGRRDLLRPLGRVLGQRLIRLGVVPESAAVTWVPANRRHRRQRGYDQGELLAAGVAESLGGGYEQLLVRRRDRSQTGQGRAGRLAGPALELRSSRRRWWLPRSLGAPGAQTGTSVAGEPLAEAPVLVVDDVVTTGSTRSRALAALTGSPVTGPIPICPVGTCPPGTCPTAIGPRGTECGRPTRQVFFASLAVVKSHDGSFSTDTSSQLLVRQGR